MTHRTPSTQEAAPLKSIAQLVILLLGIVGLLVSLAPLADAAPPRCTRSCPPIDGGGGGGGGGGAGGFPSTPLTGRFTYFDRSPNDNSDHPLSGNKVELWRGSKGFLGITSWESFATVHLDSDGRLSQSVAFDPDVTYALRIFATNDAAVVYPATVIDVGGSFFARPGDDGHEIKLRADASGQALDFSYRFADATRASEFNIASTLQYARTWAVANRDARESDDIPPVRVQPAAIATFYNSPTGSST